MNRPVRWRAFADWRPGGWHYEPGRFEVLVGNSATDLPLTDSIHIET